MIGPSDVTCVLEKHRKYETLYKPNEIYWGFGIEHETYLESSCVKTVSGCIIQTCRKPERYSVNYYKSYKEDLLNDALEKYTSQSETFSIPILINSHSFSECDKFGKNRTTYSKVPRPNPLYSGKLLIDELNESNEFFKRAYSTEFVFDGDTVEFMTLDFYNARVKRVLKELADIEELFVNELNRAGTEIPLLKEHLPISLMGSKNHPFAFHLTNIANPAMFNNGTIHINITLPTQLNDKCEIANMPLFVEQHRQFARVFQWLEPLLIAKYGSKDILSTVCPRFAKGSQRLAVSRYIGVGTFDTDYMPRGKILTIPRNDDTVGWFNSITKNSAYICYENIGLDINFNKHYSHGLEFRIFDALSKDCLEKACEETIFMADMSLKIAAIENPVHNTHWQEMLGECLMEGKDAYITTQQQERLYSLFGFQEKIEKPVPALDVYDSIISLLDSHTKGGICRRNFLDEPANDPVLPAKPGGMNTGGVPVVHSNTLGLYGLCGLCRFWRA